MNKINKTSIFNTKKFEQLAIRIDKKLVKMPKSSTKRDDLFLEMFSYIENFLFKEECSEVLMEYVCYMAAFRIFTKLKKPIKVSNDYVGFNYAGVKFIAISKDKYESLMVVS